MTTVTVQNTVTDPAGNVMAGVPVSVQLINGSLAPGYTTSSSIISWDTTTTNVAGLWSLALTPNNEITPANTYYRIVEGNGYISTIVVPASGGPYNLAALVVVPPTPTAVGITGVQVAKTGTVVATRPEMNFIQAGNTTVTVADNPANNRVDVTVSSSGGATGNVTYRGAWAATTAYNVDDLITYAGGSFIVTTGFTSGSVFALTNLALLDAPKSTYNVKWYGAQGDGVTDDTAAINAAIAAAYTAEVAAGTNTATILFPAGTYVCSSPPTQSASFKGNAQIPIPLTAVTATKFVWVLRGTPGEPLPHWQQTSLQTAGALIKCTLTGQTISGTWGPPSVIGGPTPAQGYGESANLYNNCLVVVDGIKILLPADPTLLGFDFSGVAEIEIRGASVNGSTTPGIAEPGAPTHSWAVGLYCPQRGNNDKVLIHDFSCEGMYVGMVVSEHTNIVNCQIIYCIIGIDVLTSIDFLYINYASVEVCHFPIQCEPLGTGFGKVVINCLDIEDDNSGPLAPGATINDSNNLLRGYIGLHRQSPVDGLNAAPIVVGGTGVRIINLPITAGTQTPPAVPASTTPLQNPFWRDAMVAISGGTVTVIAVDGATQFTATNHTVFVPTGKSITLTYSVAPTWTWTTL